MEFIRGLHNLKSHHQHCALTIGNFDGCHLGHQALIAQLMAIKAQSDAPVMVMCFEPHPVEFFRKKDTPLRLSRMRDKLALLQALGVQYFLCLRFDQKFSRITAQQFVESLLIDKLKTKHLVIGDDFRFGHQRQGDYELLKSYAAKGDFELSQSQSVCHQGQRVSSTQIRQAILHGEFDVATEMLGRPYTISGRVIRDRQLGRTLGFPTANLSLKGFYQPLSGVYAVTASDASGELNRQQGVANVGVRPTVCGQTARLEVHLLDWRGDLYDNTLKVEFVQKIRDEMRFESLDALKAQINADVVWARQYFKGSHD